MRGAVSVVCVVVALAAASTAFAYQYAPPRQWTPGAGAGSTFSSTWLANNFRTYGSGTDKTVTFINAAGYGWHNTRRGGADYLETYAPWPGTFKAHCVSHSYFWGSCNVR